MSVCGAWLLTANCIWRLPRLRGGQASAQLGELVLQDRGTEQG